LERRTPNISIPWLKTLPCPIKKKDADTSAPRIYGKGYASGDHKFGLKRRGKKNFFRGELPSVETRNWKKMGLKYFRLNGKISDQISYGLEGEDLRGGKGLTRPRKMRG